MFHVFGEPTNDTRLKVTYSLIEKALKQTSEDFQGLTADYDQTGASSRFENIKKPVTGTTFSFDFKSIRKVILRKVSSSMTRLRKVLATVGDTMKLFRNMHGTIVNI